MTKHGYDFEMLPTAIKTMGGSEEFFFGTSPVQNNLYLCNCWPMKRGYET